MTLRLVGLFAIGGSLCLHSYQSGGIENAVETLAWYGGVCLVVGMVVGLVSFFDQA